MQMLQPSLASVVLMNGTKLRKRAQLATVETLIHMQRVVFIRADTQETSVNSLLPFRTSMGPIDLGFESTRNEGHS